MTVTISQKREGVFFSSRSLFYEALKIFRGLELYQLHIFSTIGYTIWEQCTSQSWYNLIAFSALENAQSIEFYWMGSSKCTVSMNSFMKRVKDRYYLNHIGKDNRPEQTLLV